MLSAEQVFECIRREMEYSRGWAKGKDKSVAVEGVDPSDVHRLPPLSGQPYSIMDFMTFAEKYWDEAKEAYTNFTPDGGAVRIRLIKVLNLLARALMVHGRPSDLERLAGKSSADFPVIGGGLKKFDEVTTGEGCLIQGPGTGKLINESPGCSPLRRKKSATGQPNMNHEGNPE